MASYSGEFFVGEAGIFGVRCFCHRLRMSVAKFCEVCIYTFCSIQEDPQKKLVKLSLWIMA